MMELFRHNFDDEDRRALHKETLSNAEGIADLKAQLEEARQQGFDAGRAHGRQEAKAEFETMDAERLAQMRGTISQQLADLADADARSFHETEHNIIDLFSAVAERLVPELLDRYGIALAIERIRQSVDKARTDPVLMIRTSPEVMEALEGEAPEWLSDTARKTQIEFISDPLMNKAAALIQWKGGRLEYDLHAACYSMITALHDAAKDLNKSNKKAAI